MIKSLTALTVLTLAGVAPCVAQSWSFTVHDLHGRSEEYDFFTGEITHRDLGIGEITGSFSGTDANGNGLIEGNELSALTIFGSSVLPVDPDDPFSSATEIHAFSYSPAGGLIINADWYRQRFVSGQGYTYASPSGYAVWWDWLPQTSVTVAAVPEPEALLLALAGLGIVGTRMGMGRRRA